MRRNGNANSNRTYNPQNAKPAIPLDVDEVDAAFERFIRQKYDQRSFSGGSIRPAKRHDTGSTRSSEDQPPPLPPKPGKRFGFGLRSASSAVTLSRPTFDSPPMSPPMSPGIRNGYQRPTSPIRVNKQSRVFGATVGGIGDNLDTKLATLKDMGFPDDARNLQVLRGLGGNLERTVESLVRLGEGSGPALRSKPLLQGRNVAASQPLPSLRQQSRPAASGPLSATEFTRPKLQEQAPGNATSNMSFQPQSHNPFINANSQPTPYPVEQVFGNMQISQPLFPHATGGYPSQQPEPQDIRIQQSMTPPVSQDLSQQHLAYSYAQPTRLPKGNYNPFLPVNQVSSEPPTPNPSAFRQHSLTSHNPFLQSQTVIQSPTQEQSANGYPSRISENTPPFPYPQPQPQPQPQHLLGQNLPHLQASASSSPYFMQKPAPMNQTHYLSQPLQSLNQLPSQPLQPQPTGRFDKATILSLYNYPQLAPSPQPQASDPTENTAPKPPLPSHRPLPSPAENAPTNPPQRSVTMPVPSVSGSRNPFAPVAKSTLVGNDNESGAAARRHVSQESVDIGGFHSGRHSPDAFASLSARSARG